MTGGKEIVSDIYVWDRGIEGNIGRRDLSIQFLPCPHHSPLRSASRGESVARGDDTATPRAPPDHKLIDVIDGTRPCRIPSRNWQPLKGQETPKMGLPRSFEGRSDLTV